MFKKWFSPQPRARSQQELQAQRDHFQHTYHTARPHKALHEMTSADTYMGRPKAAHLQNGEFERSRARSDDFDQSGKKSVRRDGRMHHLRSGRAIKARKVFIIIDARNMIVTELYSGEILSENTVEPARLLAQTPHQRHKATRSRTLTAISLASSVLTHDTVAGAGLEPATSRL